jgi:hypothetical protein
MEPFATELAQFKGAESITIALDLEWYDQTGGKHPKEFGLSICVDNDSSNLIGHHFKIIENEGLINRFIPFNTDTAKPQISDSCLENQ